MKAVRLHKFHSAPVIDEVPEPVIAHPLDVIVKIGGAGVCRTDLHIIEGQWDAAMGTPLPYILGHENAGWVQRGRLGGHQRRGRRHRHPAPDPDLRAVPRVPGGRRHALRELLLPGAVEGRRDGGVPAHRPPAPASSSTPRPGRPTSPRWPTRGSPPTTPSARRCRCCTPAPPRSSSARAASATSASSAWPPCRRPGSSSSTATPTPSSSPGSSAPTTPSSPTAPTSTRSRTSPAARARTWCSTSSPSRAPRPTPGT